MSTKWKSCGLLLTLFFVVGLSLGILAPGEGRSASPDRLLALMQAARGSSCFLAPSRAPTSEALPSAIVGAAYQGDGPAMYRLAETYLGDQVGGGAGRQALPWLERSAVAGYAAAAADLGRIHAAGRGVAVDQKRAFAWWMFGATRGDPRSMACVSASYILGLGTPIDAVEAARWAILRDAASPGQQLTGPDTAALERALPAAEMLAARRRAAELPDPTPPPGAEGAIPRGETGGDAPPIQNNPAAWQSGLVALPRMPPPIPPGHSGMSGTGIVVAAPGVVLTAAHVVRGCGVLVVRAGTAELGGGEVIAVNGQLDLALLSVPGLVRQPIPVGSTTRLGAEVLVLGYPGGGVQSDRLTATLGNVSAIGSGRWADTIQFTAPVQPGNSGGPLMDRQGRLVGIAVARNDVQKELEAGLKPTQNVNYAAGPATVYRFLTDHALALNLTPAPVSDVATLVEQVERSVVRVVCFRQTPAQTSSLSRPATAVAAEAGK